MKILTTAACIALGLTAWGCAPSAANATTLQLESVFYHGEDEWTFEYNAFQGEDFTFNGYSVGDTMEFESEMYMDASVQYTDFGDGTWETLNDAYFKAYNIATDSDYFVYCVRAIWNEVTGTGVDPMSSTDVPQAPLPATGLMLLSALLYGNYRLKREVKEGQLS